MKKLLALLLALVMVLSLVACGSTETTTEETTTEETTTSDGENKLVIYSPWSELELSIAVDAFEEQTGIECEVVSGGAGELVARVQAEAADPQGDVILGGSDGTFRPVLDLWEEYVSPNDQYMLDGYHNTTGKISYYCIVPTLILVNNDLIGDIKIEGWGDLLQPELKGKIAFADPAASSLSNVLVFNMLTVMGEDDTLDTGWEFMDQLAKQLDGKVLTGSSKVPKGVADGEYIVGLTHELYYSEYLGNGSNVSAIYPEEGSAAIAGPTVIIKNAPHMENAKKFIDYILDTDFQTRYMEGHGARSTRVDIAAPDIFPAIDTLTIIPEWVGDKEVQNEVIERLNDAIYG